MQSERKIHADINQIRDGWIQVTLSGEGAADLTEAQIEAALSAAEPVSSIVPDHCSGTALIFEGGCLHVRKDGSGHIVVDEDDFKLEDDRCEGEHGSEGSVHWIARFPAGEMTALRNFLNGQDLPAPSVAVKVKPLEWAHEHNGDFTSQTVVGWYHIGLPDLTWNLTTPDGAVLSFHDLREAKSAAQTDYEARIRSALSAQVQDVAGSIQEEVREAATEVITAHECGMLRQTTWWENAAFLLAEYAMSSGDYAAAPAKQEGSNNG